MTKEKVYSINIGGNEIKFNLQELAEQAAGSILAQMGETVVLSTVVNGKNEISTLEFFPLTVEYQERYYAAGKILKEKFK